MPRLIHTVPKYRKQKASGQVVVTLNGEWPAIVSQVSHFGTLVFGRFGAVMIDNYATLHVILRRGCSTLMRPGKHPRGWSLKELVCIAANERERAQSLL